jgi:hypothetical protein
MVEVVCRRPKIVRRGRDGHLAAILTWERVLGEEFVDHLSGGESPAEQFEGSPH